MSLFNAGADTPAFINAAVTPISGNNPVYTIYHYDTQLTSEGAKEADIERNGETIYTYGKLLSYSQRYFDLGTNDTLVNGWQLLINTTLAPFSLPNLNSSSLQVLLQRFSNDTTNSLWTLYATDAMGNTPIVLSYNETILLCGMKYAHAEDVLACFN